MIPTAINQFSFPTVIADTTDMPRMEWLELRRKFIGGSDAAPISSMSRYQTPIGVYYDKTENITKPFTVQQEKRMASGNRMESVIAEWFAEETGKHVVKQPYFYAHPVHTFMGANVDYGIYSELAGLECKNSAYRKDWEDGEVPNEYFLQCQHYMAVTGAQRWYLAYCLEGWDFNYVTIERNDEIIEKMIEQQGHFWETFIVPRKPPAFDGSDSAKVLLSLLYPEAVKGSVVELPPEADELIVAREKLKESEKEVKANLMEVENQLKAMIGESEVAMTPNYIFKYATINKKEYMVKAQTYRQMNVKSRVM